MKNFNSINKIDEYIKVCNKHTKYRTISNINKKPFQHFLKITYLKYNITAGM